MWVVKTLLWIISFAFGLAFPQDLDDQAERLFTNASTFMAAGKYNEALADLQKIVDSYPKSPWADKALLDIGGYYLQVKNDAVTALLYFTRIQDQYATSESAPAAYYWKSYILEKTAPNRQGLESAVADLMRMLNLYRDHDWEDGALYLLSRLGMRLRDYGQSLNHAQRLEFSYPNSRFAPAALLQSGLVAYLTGRSEEAEVTLGRLQTRYPESRESQVAEGYLKVLDRFSGHELVYQLDRNFPGAVPKKYKNPNAVGVAIDGLVGVLDANGVHFASTGTPPIVRVNDVRELKGFSVHPDGELLFVAENRVTFLDGRPAFSGLMVNGELIDRIVRADVDHYMRLYVLDDDLRDVAVFDRTGNFKKTLQVPKALTLKCFYDSVWVVPQDGNSIIEFGPNLERVGSLSSGLVNIEDFAFDPFGNLYVLYDKGYRVGIFDQQRNVRAQLNIKNGGYPLKQAEAIAVDQTGAIYLVDRRGGSVFRFQ